MKKKRLNSLKLRKENVSIFRVKGGKQYYIAEDGTIIESEVICYISNKTCESGLSYDTNMCSRCEH